MRVWFFVFVYFVSLSSVCYAQLNPERIAFNRLQSGKWDRSLGALKKSLRKDSTNLEANYVLAVWFLTAGNPDFQEDSSHYYIGKSKRLLSQLSGRDKERAQRFPIDSLILNLLDEKIDSTAFAKAKTGSTKKVEMGRAKRSSLSVSI